MQATDLELFNRIRNLENNVRELSTARQPFQSEWTELSPQLFSRNDNNTFNNAQDFTSLLGIGDQLKWKQQGDSTYRYGYNINTTPTSTDIWAGSDYIITATQITEIYFSDSFPTDFPYEFRYIPTFSDNDSGTVTVTTPTASTSINRNEMHIRGDFLFQTTAADAESIFMTLPFALSNDPIVLNINSAIFIDQLSNIYYQSRSSVFSTITTLDKLSIQFADEPGARGFRPTTSQRFFLDIKYPFK